MTLIANQFAAVDPIFPGINQSMLQEAPVILEVPAVMADDDTTEYVYPAAGDNGLPPRLVQVLRHTGGDKDQSSPAAAATYATSDGDTIKFDVDPDGNGRFDTVTHTLSGVTGGSATAVQIAASINADTNLTGKVRAVAGLTTNLVTIFSPTPRGSVKYNGGTSVIQFPGSAADSKNRTYVSQTVSVITAGTGWSWKYVVSTRKLTVQNETGGSVNRTVILVWK